MKFEMVWAIGLKSSYAMDEIGGGVSEPNV